MSSNRRAFLNGLACSALGLGAEIAWPYRILAEESYGLLRATAKEKGCLFGASPEIQFADAPSEFRALIARQCALFAPGAPGMSWSSMEPKPGVLNPQYGSEWCNFVIAHGLRLTGAHLVWWYNTPDWFRGIGDPRHAQEAINRRIRDAMTEYRGSVFCWNVINEQIWPQDDLEGGLRRTAYLEKLGPDYMLRAFKQARQWDPKPLLAYNENDLELDTPLHEQRRNDLLRLLDFLQRGGAPIQAVGLQSHLFNFIGHFNDQKYRDFLRQIASRGLKIIISELDVSDVGLPTDLHERDRRVADIYDRFLSAALDELAVVAVVTWGLSDRYTWLTPKSLAKFGRSDGLPERPLLFDDAFRPKPAFYAILNAFRHAPHR